MADDRARQRLNGSRRPTHKEVKTNQDEGKIDVGEADQSEQGYWLSWTQARTEVNETHEERAEVEMAM